MRDCWLVLCTALFSLLHTMFLPLLITLKHVRIDLILFIDGNIFLWTTFSDFSHTLLKSAVYIFFFFMTWVVRHKLSILVTRREGNFVSFYDYTWTVWCTSTVSSMSMFYYKDGDHTFESIIIFDDLSFKNRDID